MVPLGCVQHSIQRATKLNILGGWGGVVFLSMTPVFLRLKYYPMLMLAVCSINTQIIQQYFISKYNQQKIKGNPLLTHADASSTSTVKHNLPFHNSHKLPSIKMNTLQNIQKMLAYYQKLRTLQRNPQVVYSSLRLYFYQLIKEPE